MDDWEALTDTVHAALGRVLSGGTARTHVRTPDRAAAGGVIFESVVSLARCSFFEEPHDPSSDD
jgi:hypothetical protein